MRYQKQKKKRQEAHRDALASLTYTVINSFTTALAVT